jgi:superfamily II DNA or RNA helicase
MDEDLGSHFFERHLGRLKLSWPEKESDVAFRAAQLGATLTLAGHFQTSKEPAQAVLPTGVGKTAVMCALPFLVPMRRLLVVVPTRLLRDQIGGEFATLETLRAIGAIETDERPQVHQVEHRLASADEWERLREFDVVVGTPPVLSPTYPDVADPPAGIFDFLVFDEAHHLPATTWTGVLDAHNAPSALLTATPFRRDRKLLRGTLVYHYSLRQAMDDGVYAKVRFVPVDAEPDADREIAEAAKGRLEAEPHRSEGSLLLVRTDRVKHARDLVKLYGELDVSLGLITYEHAASTVRRTLAKLRDGQLQGVASVGALVEGFDLPRLKIAAYHRPHQSLPPTLQFVGRIARVTGGDAEAELVAVRGAVTDETAALYREDAAWAELLPAIADAAVEWERDKRVYLAEADVSVASDEEISPSAITPRRTALVFDVSRCAEIDLHASIERVGRKPVIFRFVDSDGVQLALITARRISPEWLESDVLDTYEYQLVLAVHDAERQLLFISADSDTTARTLRESVGADAALQLDPQDVNRYLSGGGVRTYSSIGMRTAFAASARQASYRMVAGSSVEGAISAAESRGYALGHVIGRRDEGGELQGMGVSFKRSKIWETAASDSLLEFRQWCEHLSQILSAAGAQEARAPHLQLALPRQLRAFPERPIAAILDHRLLQGDYYITDGGRRIDLITLESEVDRISDDEL